MNISRYGKLSVRHIKVAPGLVVILLVMGIQIEPAYSQGCVVARNTSLGSGPQSEGGYMAPGQWDVSIGYRHFYSFRHFVGDVEQKQRIQMGTQVMNKVNLLTATVTYQATPRFSFSFSAPLLLASRRSNNSPYTTTAQGFGDMVLGGQGWIWRPTSESAGNIQAGFGVLLPSGRADVTNRVDAFDGRGPRDIVLDYSVQPGSGGSGMVFFWRSFRSMGPSTQLYLNANYTATPQNTNGVLRSSTSTNPLTMYNSLSDQYLVQAGFARAISKVRGLTVTFGPRWEGVPAKDLIGESLGFRRPGYAISLEPAVQYTRGMNLFTFSVGKAIHRDRTRSVPDRITGGHGDAAFADYTWFAGYSFRFGGRRSMPNQQDMDRSKGSITSHETKS